MAQLRAISSGGIRAAYDEALPAFERATGINVSTRSGSSQGDGPTTIAAQLRAGTPADVVLMSREGLDGLIADGKIMRGTEVGLARTPLALAGRRRTPPDISTVDAFKQALLHARSVALVHRHLHDENHVRQTRRGRAGDEVAVD